MASVNEATATALITEVSNELSSGTSPNLVAIVRKLLRASELLGWEDAAQWWRNELNGCQNSDVPNHRYTNASVDFRTPMMEMYATAGGAVRPSSRATIRTEPLCHPLADLVLYKDTGFSWNTGNSMNVPATTTVRGSSGSREQVRKERIIFQPQSVQYILHQVEQQCFDFAVRSERVLAFGNRVGDIFGEYRALTESGLEKIGVDETLAAIDANLQLGTPDGAKLAILGCRNILIALSNRLWQVPGLTVHPTLKTFDGKPLQLDSGQIKARLRAYLYEREVTLATGRGPTLIAVQLDRIADTLDQLYNLSSEQGKNEAMMPDAKSVVLQTFFLIGEIARITGFEPVTSISGQPGT
jgi:hypothetical protein